MAKRNRGALSPDRWLIWVQIIQNLQKNMKHVAQNLPKAVYEDCVKEELEILKKAGEFGGKLCSKVTMEIIKDKLKIG